MTTITRTAVRFKALAALAAAVALAALALAGCGGSSGTSSSKATGSTSAGSTATSTTATQPERLRACLKRLGINVPSSVSTVSDLVGNPPKGVSRAQLVAAVQSCGGIGPGLANVKPRTSASAYTHAFVSFVSCMREQGVNLPAPNTSGKGPVIDLKGVDTTSAKYKAAAGKCAPIVAKVLSLPTLAKR
jgi:hypothetical protein